uniref:Putative defense protein 3 n=1 Tax=Hippocampus comes TaxID=109280 RepID=A0A3Q2YG52_HIPCM
MQSCRLYLGTIVILSSVVPPVTAFSRGAGPASCQTMSPGHIRAQPQDLQQNHITIRTSVNSYLPGQLVTVTVRSSRDFMGFLLQARSGDDSQGPVLVRGSWTLAPPGTHTLRCLSEGDTLTHSDKQLKRNLSFVWRAPDAPVGDIRFYVTVVQSYFVYWAGIKSAVVRDGSQMSYTSKNLLPSDRAIEAPRTRPQPRSKANLQTVSPYTSTMLKSVSIFDSFGSSSRDGITQASPSRNTLDVSKRTTKNLSFTHSSSQDKSSPVFSALPKPSPVRPSIPPLPLPSQKQTRIASSNPRQEFNPSTSNRKIESNIGKELKPNPPKLDTKLLFNPSKMPGVEGKYPEIVPRHSSWELGMLLGCSAGLGMALVVGVRYVYRQACGKRTEITLHDRERDYGRGERGMIHVQECGDLVRVRRIRENSLVLLAEYDILASPGD